MHYRIGLGFIVTAVTAAALGPSAMAGSVIRTGGDNRSGNVSAGVNFNSPRTQGFNVDPGVNEYQVFDFAANQTDQSGNCAIANATYDHHSGYLSPIGGSNRNVGFYFYGTGTASLTVNCVSNGGQASFGQNASQPMVIENAPPAGIPVRIVAFASRTPSGNGIATNAQIRVTRPDGSNAYNLVAGATSVEANQIFNMTNGQWTVIVSMGGTVNRGDVGNSSAAATVRVALTRADLPGIEAGPILSAVTNNHYYLQTATDWFLSQQFAKRYGANLVTVNNQAENDYIRSNWMNYNQSTRRLWLGFNDIASEGNFTWISGQPVSFTFWDAAQPDNAGNAEDTVEMWNATTGRWNDNQENGSPSAPLNQGLAEVETGTANPTIIAGPITNPANGHRYTLYNAARPAVAERLADAAGGFIVTINDQAENDWLRTTFSNFGGSARPFMIGLNDVRGEDNWQWQSGENAQFRNWFTLKPNNAGGNRNYVFMRTDGFWEDFAVTDSTLFVIEQGAPPACPGDLDNNGTVNLTDLATLLTNFGRASGATRAQGDLDGDGDVDLTDLATLLTNFGRVC